MRWLALPVLALLLLLSVAARPRLLAAIHPAQWVIQIPVEQQTPGGATQPDCTLHVVNPTKLVGYDISGGSGNCTWTPGSPPYCLWDADDSFEVFIDGILQPGETATVEVCLFADDVAHLFDINAYGGSTQASFRLTLSVPELGWSLSNDWQGNVPGQICALGPKVADSANLPSLPEIAGSNGGRAELLTLRMSVTNTGAHAMRRFNAFARANVGFGSYQLANCPIPPGCVSDSPATFCGTREDIGIWTLRWLK